MIYGILTTEKENNLMKMHNLITKFYPSYTTELDSKICDGLSLGDRLVGQYAKFWNIY